MCLGGSGTKTFPHTKKTTVLRGLYTIVASTENPLRYFDAFLNPLRKVRNINPIELRGISNSECCVSKYTM